MKGDFSRVTFNPKKHYNRVLMQQGRVQLDADWNEQREIIEHYLRTQLIDLIGPSGTPRGAPPETPDEQGFLLESLGVADDFIIHPGRIYVQGVLCELEPGTPVPLARVEANTLEVDVGQVDGRPWAAGQWCEFLNDQRQTLDKDGKPVTLGNSPARRRITKVEAQQALWRLTLDLALAWHPLPTYLRRIVTYKTQPYWPHPAPCDTKGGTRTFRVYLDVWERTVTALEDADIREVALNGADTAIRSQIIWQVKGELTQAPTVLEAFQQFRTDKLAASPGQMVAKRSGPSATLIDNQLYRVEIHDSRGAWKWARDNASIVARLQHADNSGITLANEGRNTLSGFVDCRWVELTNAAQSLGGAPGLMVEITTVDGATLKAQDNTWFDKVPAAQKPLTDANNNIIVRCWDGYKAQMLPPDPQGNTDYDDLEENIQVRFDPGAANTAAYKPGDYWLIPARTNSDAGIEWPPGNRQAPLPLPQPPLGITHAYCPLGLFAASRLTDGRPQFANLTGGLLSQMGGELHGKLTINQAKNPANFDLVTTQKVFIAADDPNSPGDPLEAMLTVNGDTLISLTTRSLNFIRLGLTLLKDSGLKGAPYLQLVAGDPSSGQFEPKPFIAFSDNKSGAPYRALIQYTGSNTNTLTIEGKDGDDPFTVNIQGELSVNGQKISVGGSDERWKKNITPIAQALSKVLQLHGVQFEWKVEEYTDKHFPYGQQLGLVAQEVEEIVPEVVSTTSDGYKTVEYGRLVALLIESIKDLKNENDMLKQRVEILEGARTGDAQRNGHI